MPRPADPNKKVQLSVRLDPKLRREMEQTVKTDDTYDSLSDLVGQACTSLLRSTSC